MIPRTLVFLFVCAPVAAQSLPAEELELPDDVRAALADVRDFAFNFDQPGFYAIARQVDRGRSPGWKQSPLVVGDWRDLLERPADFRGRPVTIEGRVGRNKDPYTLASAPDLGPVSQLELEGDGQPLTVTAILTEPATDIPVGAAVTLTGYFVMIRQYHGPSGRAHHAALIVAPGPLVVTRTGRPRESHVGPEWVWLISAAVGGLLIVWWLLRRAARPHMRPELHARHSAPINLSDELASWASELPSPPEPDGQNVQ